MNLRIGRALFLSTVGFAAHLSSARRRLSRLAEGDGQTLVEYGLILTLIAVVAVAVMTTFGGEVSSMFGSVSEKI